MVLLNCLIYWITLQSTFLNSILKCKLNKNTENITRLGLLIYMEKEELEEKQINKPDSQLVK